MGVSLHYHKIVENEYYGYPDEWFPSVSATIGDRYPERSFFMVFIAITSGNGRIASGRSAWLIGVRTTLCSRWFILPAHSATKFRSTKIRCIYGRISNPHSRRMDICYFYRRSSMARHFHDIIFSCNGTVDCWLFGIESKE